MKFSIIMPCYNAAAFLPATIESVLAQTHVNFELIIVNDGSKDNSRQVIEEYVRRDKRISLIDQPNSGKPSIARNHGITRATGDLVAFLDADDTWEPWHLATHIKLHESPQVFFSATDYARIDETGEVKERHCICSDSVKGSVLRSALHGKNDGVLQRPADLFIKICPAWLGAVVVKRSAFSQLGGFNMELKMAEDVEMWIRLALMSDFAFSGVETAFYRRNSSSLTNTIAAKKRDLTSASMFHGLLEKPEFADFKKVLKHAAVTDYLAAAYICRKSGERTEALRCVMTAWSLAPLDIRNYKELLKALAT
jgi:GT2 family glycosyltransferase